MTDSQQSHDWLRRLDPGAYRGSACVHWSLTMQDRTTGWLILLWLGLCDGSDQRNAMKYFRNRLNPVLEKLGAALQKQPFDHVLRPDERQPEAFAAVVEYIARNAERAQLVGPDRFREYQYTNCLLPGFPEVTPRLQKTS
jgi:putative transposase